MKINKFLGLLLLSIILLVGCGKKEIEPVAINEATDTCAICNMQVMNSQFATEVILSNDKVHKFDDIGCMYNWLKENGTDDVAAQFVRDYHTKEWINSDQATYVYNESIKTPMSYHVLSFQNKEDAEQFVAENEGELLSYDDLQTHEWVMSKGNMEGHNHGHDNDGHGHGEDGDSESDTSSDHDDDGGH